MRTVARILLILAALPGSLLALEPSGDGRVPAGTVPRRVAEASDLGPADRDLPFSRVVLLLAPRDSAALETFLASQQDPASPAFHCWLTPEEFGERFGARAADIQLVSAWLSNQGLTVLGPTSGRTALLFSGRLAEVERAFDTTFRNLVWNGEPHISNVTVPTIPRELSHVVRGVVALDDFRRARARARKPQDTSSNGVHTLAPADFATIYGVDALYAAGLDGRGTTIVVPGSSQINLDDVRTFRKVYGLPAADPEIVVAGKDPGLTDEESEGDLDVQWSGAVAPAASIVYVVSEGVLPALNPDLAALTAVDRNLGAVLSYSFGWCEADSTPEYVAFYRNVWAQAAAQGISVLVASGDTGVLGCGDINAVSRDAVSVSLLASSPYCTALGGTLFDDPSAALYWDAESDPVTKRSAKGPIPEVAWTGSGGGLSAVFARPLWQDVPGLAPGTGRALPDVSLSASPHDGYRINYKGVLLTVGGTSCSTPAFAGIVALLVQKLGGRLGNLNPMLYALGRQQYGGGAGVSPFRDVTTGDNSWRGHTGYKAGAGYDLVTGLGSVDAGAFVSAWTALAQGPSPSSSDLSVGLSPGAAGVAPGESVSFAVTLTSAAGLEPVATVSNGPLPSGWTARYEPSRQSDASTGYVSPSIPATLRITAPISTPSGSYAILVRVATGTVARSTAAVVTVGVPASTAPGVEVQAPVVLDFFGAGRSHFTSDLYALNRSRAAATLLLRYVASPGTPGAGAPLVAVPIPAGGEFRTDDAIAFLRSNGIALPEGGTLGTLFATFAGVSDPTLVSAGSRTSTPNPNTVVGGSFGTFSPAWRSGAALIGDTWIYGLREDGAFRSNLALVHAPSSSSFGAVAPVTVEMQLYDGDLGLAAGAPISYTLQPGEFHQFNSVLASRGLSNGYARVRRTAGADRFIAYGVVNDGASTGGGTSDGSLIAAGATEGLLPIVLDLPGTTHYQTELTLTNPSLSSSVAVTLTYTPAALLGATGGGTVPTTLGPGRQLRVPNAISYLRALGLGIPADGKQGGTLSVSGAAALARTFNPNPDSAVGGTFGLAYGAVPASERARSGAWVFGLRQDDAMRSNLAVADARTAGDPLDYRIDVFDSDSGASLPAQSFTRTLSPGQWTQVDSILGAAGVAHGYVRVAPASGESDYVAYGVTNDGPGPGTRTSDGSYLPMVVGD